MAHKVEMVDGVAQMAWAGETPWHGLGFKVPHDLTPEQMLKKAGLDWKVELRESYTTLNGKKHPMRSRALVRLPNHRHIKDESVLTEVRGDWNPVQNLEAAEFFNDFVKAGHMDMDTAGSLCEGELVWMLAKMKDGFDLFKKKDHVESYMLFTNPHRYGWSTSVSLTPIRVVCWNTLNLSLDKVNTDKIIRINHRKMFNAEEVKLALGVAKKTLESYKETAEFLASKRYTGAKVTEYFKELFPLSEAAQAKAKDPSKTKRKAKEMTKGAATCLGILTTQPGAEIAGDSWWNAYNAATFYMDHLAGKTDDTRLQSAWYGHHRDHKITAMKKAVEYADAA